MLMAHSTCTNPISEKKLDNNCTGIFCHITKRPCVRKAFLYIKRFTQNTKNVKNNIEYNEIEKLIESYVKKTDGLIWRDLHLKTEHNKDKKEVEEIKKIEPWCVRRYKQKSGCGGLGDVQTELKSADLQHTFEGPEGSHCKCRIYLQLWLLMLEAQVEFFQCIELHVGAIVAGAVILRWGWNKYLLRR